MCLDTVLYTPMFIVFFIFPVRKKHMLLGHATHVNSCAEQAKQVTNFSKNRREACGF
jgi:hypothetical protein